MHSLRRRLSYMTIVVDYIMRHSIQYKRLQLAIVIVYNFEQSSAMHLMLRVLC